MKKRLIGLIGIVFCLWIVGCSSTVSSISETSQTKSAEMEVKREPVIQQPKYRLRSEPILTNKPKSAFKLDENSRPLEYIENDFTDNGDGTITDRATGLMWQKSGSNDMLRYGEVQDYIYDLNRQNFAGHNDWRLPTADELKSLITPNKMNGDMYINSIFDKKQSSCRISDYSVSKWEGVCFVTFSSGEVICNYLIRDLYVRAVRSLTP